jgi:3-methyl-2-oxobutanoate hydroxymethyltransferase
VSEETAETKVTAAALRARKDRGPRIAMLTAYDYPTALLEDRAGIDAVLVGDSVGTNLLGYRTPQEVTMADMLHHARAVRRGVTRAFLLVDLPFMSYQVSAESALVNAGRLVQEGGAEGVKLEGGAAVVPQIRAIAGAGIPVVGHLGFTPQSQAGDLYVHSDRRGTVAKFQGKGPQGATALLEEARRLEDAGIFALILEMVTEEVARLVTERVEVPVIGIGAGRYCDGQVLTVTDLIGLSDQALRLAKSFLSLPLREQFATAFAAFGEEVRQGLFPAEENVRHMEPELLRRLEEALGTAPSDR